MAKVLIAAATELVADFGQTLLGSDSLERVFAPTHSAALEVARSYVPSLVVIDGSDPSGACSFIRKLRGCPGTRRSSILALSRTSSGSQDDLLRAGANLVLTGLTDTAGWDTQIEQLLTVPRRLRIRFAVRVTPAGAEGSQGEPITGIALDVSLAGMLLQTAAPLEAGMILGLEFVLPGQQTAIHAGACVMRVTGQPKNVQAGMNFLQLPIDAQERIRELLTTGIPEQAFGRYEVLGLLGEGSMGKVYRAFDPLAQRVVAIKTPKTESLSAPEVEEYLKRFRREAQAAAQLTHPNIVTVFDVGDDFFAMELVEGATLDIILHERGALLPEEACAILRPIAAALDHAHALGIVHRDIKPANLIVPVEGQAKVMDFGVAYIASAVITASGQAFGSPAYMAPEQILSGIVTPQSDVFALAVVAYEALVGRKPFDGESISSILYQVVNTEPPAPSSTNAGLPRGYDAIFQRALAKLPSARFATAAALVDALEGGEWHGTGAPISMPTLLEAPGSMTSETMALRTRPDLGATTARPGTRSKAMGALAVMALLAAGAVMLRPMLVPRPAGQSARALQIATEPRGAAAFLDGRPAGTTPVSLADVSPGPHSVRVELKDFDAAELRLVVAADDPPVPLHFVLQPQTPTVEVQSDPAPASVQVDGVAAGSTPLTALPLRAGPHEVRIERPGFLPWSQTIEIVPGTNRPLEVHLRQRVPAGGKRSLRDLGWTQRGDRVDVGPGVTPPERISSTVPVYPEVARQHHIEGSVTAELIVDETGAVVAPRIVESAGDILDEAMLQAVRAWKYRPAESNGTQVRVRIRERYTFDPSR